MNKLFKRSLLTILIAGSFFVQSIFGMQEQNQATGFEFVYNDFSLLPKARNTLLESFAPVQDFEQKTEAELEETKINLDEFYYKYLEPTERLPRENQFFHVIKKDTEVIAFGLFYKFSNNNHVFLNILCVHPDFQHQGLGRRLVLSIFEKQECINRIYLITPSDQNNKKAHSFYEKLGARIYTLDSSFIFYEITKANTPETNKQNCISRIYSNIQELENSRNILRDYLIDNINIDEIDHVESKLEAMITDIKTNWQPNPQSTFSTFWETAKLENRIIGFVLFHITNKPDELYLETLAIDINQVRLARELIDSVLNKYPKIRRIKTYQNKGSKNYRYFKFLESLGFVKIFDTPTIIGYEFIQENKI